MAETNKKSNLLKYGVENIAQVPEIKAKISKSQKEIQSKYSYEERLNNTQKARESFKCKLFRTKNTKYIRWFAIEYTRQVLGITILILYLK